jgi:hypothetical protein
MLTARRLVLCACALFAVGAPVRRASAQAPGSLEISESIDDPKVERRLGTRTELTGGAVASAVDAAGAAVDRSARPSDASGLVAPLPEGEAVARPGTPAAAERPRVPHMKLAYRWLPLANLKDGAVSGRGADETFHVVSLDLYPISSMWRLGLSTQYGWESGTFRAGGDAFLAQSISLGGQIPGQTFTPFFEPHAGVGFMQRMHVKDLDNPQSAIVMLGIDVGTEIFMARYAHLSLALGYLHTANYFAGNDPLGGYMLAKMLADSFTIKVGFGI